MGKWLQKFKKDISGIILAALGLFMLAALVSFNPADPSLNSMGGGLVATNYCGIVGSYLADIFYQLFGLSSWIIAIGVIRFAWATINSSAKEEVSLKDVRYFWSALLIVTFSSLLSVYFGDKKMFHDQIFLGGLLGIGVSKALTAIFNHVGVQIILWATALVLTVFYSERSLQELIALPGQTLKAFKKSAFYRSVLDSIDDAMEAFEKPEKKPKLALVGAGLTSKPSAKQPPPPPAELVIARPVEKVVEDEDDAREIGDLDDLNLNDDSHEDGAEDVPDEEEAPRRTTRKVVMKTKVERRVENWELPKLSLLEDPPASRIRIDEKEIKRKAELLTNKFAQFDVTGQVVGAKPGPAVTMFEFKPSADVKLSKITDLADDLSLALSSESLRIIAPIPGRDVVGIETSNTQRETVFLKDLLAEEDFWNEKTKLPIALGKQADGEPRIVDLRKMPHLLVAGTTGSGKSVFTVSTITGFLFRHSPKTLRMILIDPKQVDLAAFSKVPHLMMPIISEPKKAVTALRWAVKEMEKRYRSLSKFGVRGIEDFNENVAKLNAEQITEHETKNAEIENAKRTDTYYYTPQPYIAIVVEEFADLMAIDKQNVEHYVVRLAQMARACGIHLMLAMQSPRKEVVTGLIKTNIPGRISFKVASKTDSRIILDEGGAERLLAQGDMLFLSPGVSKPMRHHGPYLKDAEINSLAKFWSDQGEPDFDETIMRMLEGNQSADGVTQGEFDFADGDEADQDDRYDEILAWTSTQKYVSASLIQRRFRLGYPRAARLIEIFEKEGVVGPANGSKPRQVLVNSYAEQ